MPLGCDAFVHSPYASTIPVSQVTGSKFCIVLVTEVWVGSANILKTREGSKFYLLVCVYFCACEYACVFPRRPGRISDPLELVL